MALIDQGGGTYYYTNAGTNTLTQVTAGPTTIYAINIAQFGGSAGWLQVYNNGSADAVAGTPDFTYAVASGTSGAGTPSVRQILFDPYGRQLDGGLSILWAAGATGTAAHGVNASVDITLSRIL